MCAISADLVWVEPGGAASIGFHLRHLRGPRPTACSPTRVARHSTAEPEGRVCRRALTRRVTHHQTPRCWPPGGGKAVERALCPLAGDTPRGRCCSTLAGVGRARSCRRTCLGLLFHAAEHASLTHRSAGDDGEARRRDVGGVAGGEGPGGHRGRCSSQLACSAIALSWQRDLWEAGRMPRLMRSVATCWLVAMALAAAACSPSPVAMPADTPAATPVAAAGATPATAPAALGADAAPWPGSWPRR